MITGIMRLMLFFCCLLVLSGILPSALLAADAKPVQPAYTNEELLTRMLVVDASEQVLDAVPALAVTFSQDLDPKAAFDSYFTVTQGGKAVKGGWVMAGNARRLYFSAIEPDREYRIQLRPGISSRSGLQLKQSADFTIKTRSITPVYDFATRGSVLPVRLTGGLPVRVINVPELDVEFLRVKPEQLQQVLKTLSLDQSISNWQLDEIHAVSDSVFTNRYVTDARHNARETLLLPVESIEALKAPGVYFAILRQPGRFAENAYRITHFLVTNVGLHARLYAGRLEVFAHALDTGKAISDVALTLAGDKESLSATTDADGMAAFEHRPEGALLLTAMQDGEDGFAFLDLRQPALDLSEYAVSGRTDQPVKPFIYSPRDLYRPGETVDLSILLRNRDGLPEGIKSLNLQVLRPDAKLLGEYTLGAKYEALGYFESSVKIPADAPTGLWRVELRLGAQDKQVLESLAFHVEDFMPERMKLSLSTDETLLTRGKKQVVSARGDYLYGAPAAGNKLTAVRTLALDRHPLPELADFYFGNPADQSLLQREALPEKKLDDSGATFLELPALPDTIGSPLKVRVAASLGEPGGRVVTRNLDERFWPVQNLVGIRPLFRNDRTENDAEARFEIVRTNADGQLQAGEKLSATLIREDYEYYWEYNDQEGWKRQEVRNEYPVTRQPLVLTAGQKGEVAFRVGYGRYRLEVEDGDTQLKAVYGFSAGWVGAEDGLATRPDQIELKLDKATYREGDTARLTIRPPAAGEAVVAIESDRLLWSQPLSLALEGTEIEIPVGTGSDWARHDLYVSVVSFRPADRSEKIAPNRSLGLIHLPLDRSDRRMALSISAPEKTLPEKPVIVSVQAKGLEGQKAILTLSAVDAGVLNITRFKTPDPFGYYFDREAYDVDIHDDYGKIIESVDGKALRQRFGGDAPVGLAGGALARADVQIVSLFRGAVEFDPEGRADIELTLPGFDGQLRLMAVAASETRFGSAERDMTVASPVVVSLAGPRFLANGDSSFVTVEMRNTGETEQKVVLKVKANDLLEFVPTDQAYTLQKGQREVLRLPLAAHRSFGVGNLQLQLAGSDFVANRFLNLALRPAYPARREDFRYELQGDAIQPVPSALVKPYLPESLRARLTIAPTPVLPVANALDGLLHYPYGCLEQTASSAYPYLFLELEDAERWGFSPINMQERNERVQAALVRLAGMQLSEGDFTMWGGYGASESWLTPYVADFLVSARRQGFPVPDRMYDQVMAYLERRMQEGHRGELYGYSDDPEHLGFASRAYGAYVLARENRAVLGTLRSMYQQDVSKARTGLPLVHLGLALALQGDGAKGEELINKGLAMVRKPDLYLGDYGSPVRDKAMMLYQLLSNKRQVPALGEQVNALSRSIFERDYLSTQEQAFIFLLGNQLARQSAESWQARLKIGENFIDLKRNGVYVQGLTAADISAGVSLISTQDQPLYASLVLDGYPVDAPAPRSKPVAVSRDWFRLDGTPVTADQVQTGDLLLARLELRSSENIRDALVVDLLPAGFELENTNLYENDTLRGLTLPDEDKPVLDQMGETASTHVEFRDDRYLATLELRKDTVQRLFYLVRVVSSGRFLVPPPYVEDMYRPDIRGIGGSAGIVRPGS